MIRMRIVCFTVCRKTRGGRTRPGEKSGGSWMRSSKQGKYHGSFAMLICGQAYEK